MKKLLTAIMLLITQTLFANNLQDLTQDQINKLESGSKITITKNISGSSLPEVTIYSLSHQSELNLMAVFVDYNRHSLYMPSVKFSKNERPLSNNIHHVRYDIKLPFPLRDDSYTLEYSLSGSLEKKNYELKWDMIKSFRAKKVEGYLIIEPYKGKSLVIYNNLMDPGIAIAGSFARKAVEKIQQTVSNYLRETEDVVSNNPDLLKEQIKRLEEML